MSTFVQPLRVLWTLPYLPWPTSNGGRTRQYSLIRQMALRGHRITLLCLSKDAPDWQGLQPLRDMLDDLIVVRRRARTSPATLLAAACSTRRPAVAAVNGCNPEYTSQFEQLLRQGFDLVQVEHSYAFEPLSNGLLKSSQPFLLTEHNVESTVLKQQYNRLPFAMRWVGKLDEIRGRTWEAAVMRRADCVLAVTPQDQRRFASFGARATALVPNCIDTGAFGHITPNSAAERLLFLGNYEYSPNTEAVERLCNRILPSVWKTRPAVRLTVCGHATPPEWRKRWPDSRISFEGFVEDLSGTHGAHSIFVAPLRAGGGSKLKVLEAMASSLPLVGTAESVSGLSVTESVHYLAGETDEQLASAVILALNRPEWARSLGREGRAYVRQHHDWAVSANALEDVYAQYGRAAAACKPQLCSAGLVR